MDITNRTKVLLADNDPHVQDLMRHSFKQKFELLEANDGKMAVQLVRSQSPDLVILDAMIPIMGGHEVCREIRRNSDVPIILLSDKDDVIDRVLGLELGADDYVMKPFIPCELIARMKAIFRRMQPRWMGQVQQCAVLKFQDLSLDSTRREVIVKGQKVQFRPKEFNLLFHMANSPGIVFTRELLLDQIWGSDFYRDTRTVDVHVKKIRQRLRELDSDVMHTVWGVGYKFEIV
ncbi:MAG: DNA-binding response regulator [Bacilli bacterium]|nr:DNA-binding response regulator [Bacilli bacterium]